MKIIITNNKSINPEYTAITPSKIDTLEDSSCLEISIPNLDYMVNPLLLIQVCKNKLRNNGELVIAGLDIVKIAQAISIGALTIEDANKIFFDDKKSMDNVHRLKMFMNTLGMEILDIRLQNFSYLIKVKKHD